MDCPKCGGEMEKGGVATTRSGRLMWSCDKTIEKYSKFPKSLLPKCDVLLDGINCKVGGNYSYEAYRCKECGAVLIIPPKNNSDENSDTEV
ncbi:MAG: hypothetical protein K2J73_00950 [Oscillospiraceae bacterium]|nr:hypothetical protein [Oscillospiraceae bacterium]